MRNLIILIAVIFLMSSCKDDLNLTEEQAAIQGEWLILNPDCESFTYATLLRFTPEYAYINLIEEGFEYTIYNDRLSVDNLGTFDVEEITSTTFTISTSSTCVMRYKRN